MSEPTVTTPDYTPTATWPYNSVMLTSGFVQSTREHVNVMPHVGSQLNHYYSRARGDVRTYVAECVRDALVNDVRVGWAHRIGRVTVWEDYSERGLYRFTVWSAPEATKVTR